MPYSKAFREANPGVAEAKARASFIKWKKANPEAYAASQKKWRSKRENRDKVNRERAEWDKRNPDANFNGNLRRKYRITREIFGAMTAAQAGLCKICRRPPSGTFKGKPAARLDVDHCHKTGKVRGLLCHPCNTLLGMAKERIETLLTAVEYLDRTEDFVQSDPMLRKQIGWKGSKPFEGKRSADSDTHIRKTHGITPAQFHAMNERQGGVCRICAGPPYGIVRGRPRTRLDIDHCHETDRIRGLLCHGCNIVLGMARDKKEVLLSAAEYLRQS